MQRIRSIPAPRLSRRQLASAAGSGAMLGSAWAAAFRQILTDDDLATVTVARSHSALAALVAYRGHRIAIVDAADEDGASDSLALTTGFLRQRIDAILAPTELAGTLRRDMLARWRVREVWTLPDLPDPSGRGLAGRSLSVGGLRIEPDALPRGAWRADGEQSQPWYAAVTFGATRVTVVSDGPAIDRVPIDPRLVNVVVCGDIEMRAPERAPGLAALAVPAELIEDLRDVGTVVSLAGGQPVVFRLHGDGIELPSTV